MNETGKLKKIGIRNSEMLEIISNFRAGLMAMLPVLEKANIPWRNVGMYDDFDGIAESLFEWMVLHKLENNAIEQFDVVPELAKYGYIYKNYSKKSFIQVIIEKDENFDLYVFNFISTKNAPFDTLICNIIDFDGNLKDQDVEVPFEGTKFRFQSRRPE
jgi:hypothetical protein